MNAPELKIAARVREGLPYPRGASWDGKGVNFAVYSAHATKVEVCLFQEDQEIERVELPEYRDETFHGYVPDLQPFMEQAAIAIAPLREGGGLRGKVLEAFAHGRTMVATPVAIAGIGALDHKHLRVAADTQAFAAAVVDLLCHHDRRHGMETAARKLVERHYTKEHAAARYEQLYQELMRS